MIVTPNDFKSSRNKFSCDLGRGDFVMSSLKFARSPEIIGTAIYYHQTTVTLQRIVKMGKDGR
jgi:hypothetical protein